MTSTDTLISTDDDGTEHWERSIWPTGLGAFNYNILRTDGSAFGPKQGFYSDFVNVNPDSGVIDDAGSFSAMQWRNDQGASGELTYFAAMLYWSALDDTLPDDAALLGYQFAFPWIRWNDTPFANIFLTCDLWTADTGVLRPTIDSTNIVLDPDSVVAITTDAPADELVPNIALQGVAESQDTDPANANLVTQDLDSDRWAMLKAIDGEFALRFTIRPPIFNVPIDRLYLEEEVMLMAATAGVFDYGPRFIISYTLPGTAPPPIIMRQPKFHNARQVLDAHRQPAIRIGRRPVGRTTRRFN